MTRERATEVRAAEELAAQPTTGGPSNNDAIAAGNIDDVARLIQAQPARREPIIEELHRSRGNAFVQQVLAAVGNAENHERRHQEAGGLWQKQDAAGGGFDETKNSADTSKKKDRRPLDERLADKSDNATYHAMNVQLKLLAYELHAASQRLTFQVALESADKNEDKVHVDAAEARIGAVMDPPLSLAMTTSKQFRDLRTPENDPRLAEGGQALLAALDEVQPALDEADAWATAHKRDTWGWPVVRVSRGILKLVFPNLVPASKPLTKLEHSKGFIRDAAIDAHIDAAIVAAEAARDGTAILYEDRIKLHAKELAELLGTQPRIGEPLKARIKRLVKVVDELEAKEPWLKEAVNEAIDPIRNVK